MVSSIFSRVVLLYIFLALTGCTAVSSTANVSKDGYTQSGKASFYADKYQSRKTANGERFNQNSYTAAHKKLPFGTKVEVTNVKNGKSIVVRINDRGPFVRGRIIDLSRAAFTSIGDTKYGVIDVTIEVVN